MHSGIFIFIAIRLLIYLLREDEKVPAKNDNNGIEYLVNGKRLQVPHIDRCRELLNIPDDKLLTDKEINNAYFRFYKDVAALREKVHVYIDVAELRAAKSYLLDRWAYMAHKN